MKEGATKRNKVASHSEMEEEARRKNRVAGHSEMEEEIEGANGDIFEINFVY